MNSFFIKLCKTFLGFFVYIAETQFLMISGSSNDSKSESVLIGEDFSSIFNKYFDKVYRFFYFRLRNEQDAEDLSSEVFEKILKNMDKYEERECGLNAWIFKIANNCLIDFFRRNKHAPVELNEELFSVAEDFNLADLDKKLFMENLWEVVKTLPEKQQEIWSYKLADDISHREIAKIMGLSESNVNVMFHRSLKLIKQKISYLYEEK